MSSDAPLRGVRNNASLGATPTRHGIVISNDTTADMQIEHSLTLPKPDSESSRHSMHVTRAIAQRIAAAGGAVSFGEFMHLALYAPGLGYYSAGAQKFGAAGDFVTAPEISAIFGRVLARQCAEVIVNIEAPAILEYGAGSGKLAADLLNALAELDALPETYYILEISADLSARQRALLRREAPDVLDRISWVDRLPVGLSGVVIANEVIDALPVERFVIRGDEVRQLYVTFDAGRFAFVERDASEPLTCAVREIESDIGAPLPDGYMSEVSLAIPGWIADLGRALAHGLAFVFDYGVPRHEYYAADRHAGWLRCHFRHHAHDDPLIYPGIQDLTSWVDFSAVASAAATAGLTIAGFVSQAHFLIHGGLDVELAGLATLPVERRLRLSSEVKLLTLPAEMGERFKCLGLSRGPVTPPTALRQADRTKSL